MTRTLHPTTSPVSATSHHFSGVCKELESPNIPNLVLSIFLVFGILVSYIPQHVRIIRRRSSEGLSPWFVLLGTTSGTCAIANILVLPTSRTQIQCCAVNSSISCVAGLLGIAQIGVQWSCFFVIMLLFIIFIPRHGIDHRNGVEIPLEPTDAGLREALIVVATCITHFFIILLVCIVVLARYPTLTAGWANFLGLLCAVLASIQYLPQIWTTWHLKHVGSLSIPTMCIQTPGAFVFAASLAIRLGSGGWSAWVVYIVTGCLQGCLLVMAIIFELREQRERKKGPWETSEGEEVPNGRANIDFASDGTPLLRDNQHHRSLPRRMNPRDHPLAQHRLNPDPDSPSSSFLADHASFEGADERERPKNRSKNWWSTWSRAG